MPPGYRLRPAQSGDRDFLWSLKRRTLRPYVEKTWGNWKETEQHGWFLRIFSPEAVQIVVVEDCDAGMLEVVRAPEKITLANIALMPEFQGRGFGTALVTGLQDEAKAAGVPLHLQVLKANLRAHRLYVRLGFLPAGETPTHRLMSWPA